jgi:hypothetical protein
MEIIRLVLAIKPGSPALMSTVFLRYMVLNEIWLKKNGKGHNALTPDANERICKSNGTRSDAERKLFCRMPWEGFA